MLELVDTMMLTQELNEKEQALLNSFLLLTEL